MYDNQGNPMITNPISFMQRVFQGFKNIVRVGRNASDAFLVSSAAITASGTASGTVNGQTGVSIIPVETYDELAVDVNVTAITGTPTYNIAIDRLGADGVWYTVYTGANITAAGAQSVTIGKGASTNVGFGKTIRVRDVVTGGTTPSITRSISIVGK